MASNLETYRRKRDFRRTPEPKGGLGKRRGLPEFVIQKHDATRLHYDFRLEHDGVLKSWAVPKEPSPNPRDRRLAVRTEDHPLEYARFEGEIPEHEYGAGTVVIWDRGRWEPDGDPERGLAEGKLDFELHGERLRGRWTLVRMRRRPRKRPENWLLIKRSDSTVRRPPPRAERARKKKRTRNGGKRGTAPSAEDHPGAVRGALPAQPAAQLATLVREPPGGAGWIHEPKLDGYRLLCRVERGRATLLTRRGKDWTDRFPSIAAAVQALPCRAALLDGEAVVFDSRGLTDFQALQNAIGRGDPAIALVAFDLLHLDGWDLRGAALRERKALLHALLSDNAALRYGEHVTEAGGVFFREACRLGLEGIVSKRADDPYRETRTRSWLKVKCSQRQEFVIIGYTDPAGARRGLGALLLGTRESRGAKLRYAGKVGTGFDEAALRSLERRLEPLAIATAAIDAGSRRGLSRRGVHWVKPELVAEISFNDWTAGGRLRHPVFHGLREDKPAGEVRAERASNAPGSRETTRTARPPRVALTNPDRELFPEPGITKRQLANYWESVAERALPFLSDRPLTLYRCPEGYARQCFFQKHVGIGVPEAVGRVTISNEEEPYAVVNGLPALLGLVQIGALELHVWGARTGHLDQPDIIVLDLDPAEDVAWGRVVEAALLMKAKLEALGLAAFARLTGGKGLHVVSPVVPGPRWPAVKKFARALAEEVVREEPRRFTSVMAKNRRSGKIFIDYLRNDREATAIASYSPRARAGAPVALPVDWSELHRHAASPPRYGIRDVSARLRRSDDPWEGFEAARAPLV